MKHYKRLVAQNGLNEVPYERVAFRVETRSECSFVIFASFEAGPNGTFIPMANYRTIEDVRRVLNNLRSPDEDHDGYFLFSVRGGKMTSFSQFKEIVRALGGPWAGSNVVFTRSQSEYHASCNGDWVHLIAPGGYWSAKGHDTERRMTW